MKDFVALSLNRILWVGLKGLRKELPPPPKTRRKPLRAFGINVRNAAM
jgi:hypothetical protein